MSPPASHTQKTNMLHLIEDANVNFTNRRTAYEETYTPPCHTPKPFLWDQNNGASSNCFEC